MIIKFINLNILHGGKFFPKILDYLRKEQPDILALQEATNGSDPNLPNNLRSIDVLKKEFPHYHFSFAPEHLWIKEVNVEFGNVIFARYPIIKRNTIFFDVSYGEYFKDDAKTDFSMDPRNMQEVILRINNTSLHIFNLHGIWGLDGGDTNRRLQMSQIIVDQVKDKNYVILSGDFNLKPDTQTITNIEQELNNVFKMN